MICRKEDQAPEWQSEVALSFTTLNTKQILRKHVQMTEMLMSASI